MRKKQGSTQERFEIDVKRSIARCNIEGVVDNLLSKYVSPADQTSIASLLSKNNFTYYKLKMF